MDAAMLGGSIQGMRNALEENEAKTKNNNILITE